MNGQLKRPSSDAFGEDYDDRCRGPAKRQRLWCDDDVSRPADVDARFVFNASDVPRLNRAIAATLARWPGARSVRVHLGDRPSTDSAVTVTVCAKDVDTAVSVMAAIWRKRGTGDDGRGTVVTVALEAGVADRVVGPNGRYLARGRHATVRVSRDAGDLRRRGAERLVRIEAGDVAEAWRTVYRVLACSTKAA